MTQEQRDELGIPTPIQWKKNPFKDGLSTSHAPYFEDGTVFIGAILVGKPGNTSWEIDQVYAQADGDVTYLKYDSEDGTGDPYTSWDFTDFDYYIVLSGAITEEL